MGRSPDARAAAGADAGGVSRVRVNGVALHVEERGSGAPILCIHGSLSSAAVWADAAATLATRGRAITYDRRGSARSERPDPYVTSVRQHADDAAALLDALGAAPAVVIGRSYGADTAIDLALRHAGRVRALVLLEGGECLTAAGRRWLAGLEEQVLAAAGDGGAAVAEATVRVVLGDGAWEALPAPLRETFAANGPAVVAELRGGFLDAAPEDLAAIAQAALVVAAADSPPVFAEAAGLLVATMPAARLARVDGGHMIDPAHPEVLAFVDEVLARR